MLFSDWTDMGRIVVVGALAYAALLLFRQALGQADVGEAQCVRLRDNGRAGFHPFLGRARQNTVSLAEGVLAIALLILLQYGISSSTVRWQSAERIVTSRPVLVVHRGAFLAQAMRDERVTEADVRAAIRASGKGDVRSVLAVVLENDGSLSVIAEASNEGLGLDGL